MNKKYTDLPPVSHPDYARLWRQTKQDKAKRLAYHKAYYAQRKEEVSKKDKARREANPAYHRENAWRRHGIINFTYVEYLERIELQNNLCKICSKIMKMPHVDHDHKTGIVRGLLCQMCNVAIAMFSDNPETLYRAIEYLKDAAISFSQLPITEEDLSFKSS